MREHFYRLAGEDNRRHTATPCEAIAIKIGFFCGGSINDHLIDVLMLDMIMPEKDGIDVLNEVLLTGIPVKVVLTSGFSESYLRLAEGVARFHDNPNVSVLRKPFRREELMQLLRELTAD